MKEFAYIPGGPTHWIPHIRFKGVWDMQDLYEFLADYFRERKYKFHEKVYKHKHPSPFGVERQYIWEAEQEMDEIYTLQIQMYMHTYDAHDIEVRMKEGELKVYTQGRIWIEINCKMLVYPEKNWIKTGFTSGLRDFMNNFLMRKKHGEDLWDVLMYREVQKLVWLIRRRLKMEYDEYEQKNWLGVHR